jgi:hypothetical protein
MSIAQGRDIYLYDWEVDFNYSLSTSELFKRFAIWDIVRCGSLRSLACATPSRSELLRMYTTLAHLVVSVCRLSLPLAVYRLIADIKWKYPNNLTL